MNPSARPAQRVSRSDSDSVKGVKDAWTVVLPLAGITFEWHDSKLSKCDWRIVNVMHAAEICPNVLFVEV